MGRKVGIRREDKSIWEKRAPLAPGHVKKLTDGGMEIIVQPSDIRIFPDSEYADAGAVIQEDLSGCDAVLAIKEVPVKLIADSMTYSMFAHVIKGQSYNMGLLQDLLDRKCTLYDYEKITDGKNRRLIFFGRFAGLAGMVDTLWALGQRLEKQDGIKTPFTGIQMTYNYADLEDAKKAVRAVGEKIKNPGLPEDICPLIFGFAGYGNVSMGAQEILDCLPVKEITPQELADGTVPAGNREVYKVVFKEEHMVVPVNPDQEFDLMDYYQHPEKYRGVFDRYVDKLSVLVNAIYWDEKYPRILSCEDAKRIVQSPKQKLIVVGDISCDIKGAVECTLKATQPDNPVYVYEPGPGEAVDGVKGDGIVVLAVDNLPCELSRDSSEAFGDALAELVPHIAESAHAANLDEAEIPDELMRSLIVWRGELTEDFKYLNNHLDKVKEGEA